MGQAFLKLLRGRVGTGVSAFTRTFWDRYLLSFYEDVLGQVFFRLLRGRVGTGISAFRRTF